MAENEIKVYEAHTRKEWKQILFRREQERSEHFVVRLPKELVKDETSESLAMMGGWMMPLLMRCGARMTPLGDVVDVEYFPDYRTGVRMHDAWRRASTEGLTELEIEGLRQAEKIVAEIRKKKKTRIGRLSLLYKIVSERIDYKRGEWKTPEFATLITCAPVMKNRRGNCQGFADVMYLMGGMLGFSMGIQNGHSPADAHAWNTVRIDGCCYALDASAAAVARMKHGIKCDYSYFLMGLREVEEQGMTWRMRDQSLILSPELLPEHDYYRQNAVMTKTMKEAVKLAWETFMKEGLGVAICVDQVFEREQFIEAMMAYATKWKVNMWLLQHNSDGKYGFKVEHFRKREDCVWFTVNWVKM